MITVTPHLDVHLNNKSFVSKDILCLTRDEQFLSIENVQFSFFSNFPGTGFILNMCDIKICVILIYIENEANYAINKVIMLSDHLSLCAGLNEETLMLVKLLHAITKYERIYDSLG